MGFRAAIKGKPLVVNPPTALSVIHHDNDNDVRSGGGWWPTLLTLEHSSGCVLTVLKMIQEDSSGNISKLYL